MKVSTKYVTEFVIQNSQIKNSRVIGDEYATDRQKKAIKAARPLLLKFVKTRLTNEEQFRDCIIHVRVGYVETDHGLQLTFKA